MNQKVIAKFILQNQKGKLVALQQNMGYYRNQVDSNIWKSHDEQMTNIGSKILKILMQILNKVINIITEVKILLIKRCFSTNTSHIYLQIADTIL